MEIRQDESPGAGPRPAPAESPAVKEAVAWVQQFARTLKTCRLYDGDSSTVVRFRAELTAGLAQLLAADPNLTLTFTSTEVLCEAGSGPAAALQDESLATTFYRDGIRRLVLHQGIEQNEVNTLLDLVLRVSGPRAEEEDLVTLVWDADLPHVTLNFVSIEGEVEGAGDAENGEGDPGAIAPWPASEGGRPQPAGADSSGSGTFGSTADGCLGRSDDWLTPTTSGTFEGVFEDIEESYQLELARFRSAYTDEYQNTNVRISLDLMRDCLEVANGPADFEDLRQFLFRPLHEALGAGEWGEAGEALGLIHRCGGASDLVDTLVQDLCQPNSLTCRNVISQLDRQDAQSVEQFLVFARALGPGSVEWLMHVLASSEKRDVRLALAATVSDLCRDKPERMIPWLSDSRWYVVRNVIHILGRIGGPRILELLRDASEHDEYRVRQEVVTAAVTTGAEEARPLLIGMLNTMDTRLFCAALRQLSTRRDPELARILIAQLQDPCFHERPMEERRAVYVAIAAVGDDETVPALEAELTKGSWFTRSPDAHCRAAARCLLHLDTRRAREALAAGRCSRRRAVRKACEEALGGGEP